MKTLAVLSRKGGVGKTTVAVHLAAAAERDGRRPVLADLDPQRSAYEWSRLRKSRAPAVVQLKAGALFASRQTAAREGLPLLILDTPGSADDDAVVRPSVLDLIAVARSVELVRQLAKPALVVLNQALRGTRRWCARGCRGFGRRPFAAAP